MSAPEAVPTPAVDRPAAGPVPGPPMPHPGGSLGARPEPRRVEPPTPPPPSR